MSVRRRAFLVHAMLAAAACAGAPPAAPRPGSTEPAIASSEVRGEARRWIGTWATSPQPPLPEPPQTFKNQTLRLVVHTSVGGAKIRIKISNTFGDRPLRIGAAHLARRTAVADVDPSSDRTLKFQGEPAATVAAGATAVSDPVDLDVPALSDLAVSLFLPDATAATTAHILAKQTSYLSPDVGDVTAAATFPVAKKLRSWPFLTGVDVEASARGQAIVAFGSSLTDGDGSTTDTNRRWPDVLAERLQKDARTREIGVLNEGIIGNRLLKGSPEATSPFGAALGPSGLARFERDVLAQAGVRYVVVGIGINDIAFPGALTPEGEVVTAESLIAGYRELVSRAHQKGVRVIGTTNPPFEDAFLKEPPVKFYSPQKEALRDKVNAWIRSSGEFDAVIDFDAAVRDPSHPTRLLPSFDSGDHIHPNNEGYVASGNAVPLALFEGR